MSSRADRSTYASWWWTIDRAALLLMLALITIGLMLAFAASPAATGGPLTAGDFRYTIKQILFAGIAAGILGGASLLSLQQLKITAAITLSLEPKCWARNGPSSSEFSRCSRQNF
jgi:cell division protein FtsW